MGKTAHGPRYSPRIQPEEDLIRVKGGKRGVNDMRNVHSVLGMKVTNVAEANKRLARAHRPGWELTGAGAQVLAHAGSRSHSQIWL